MGEDYWRVAQAISTINGHSGRAKPLSPQGLAVQLDVGDEQLRQLFSRWADVSPEQFLRYASGQPGKKSLAHGGLAPAWSPGAGRVHADFVRLVETDLETKSTGGRELRYCRWDTPFGPALFVVTPRGAICQLSFFDREDWAEACAGARQDWPNCAWAESPALARECLGNVFVSGRAAKPVELQVAGTPLQLAVWRALLGVPEGVVVSYQQLAALAGHPRAVRAVASAVAANPVAYLIPCHRVIRADGSTGKYRWSPLRKQAMLVWEQSSIERRRGI